MADPETALLFAGLRRSGEVVREEVRVAALPDGTLRVLASPGLVQNIARGDVVRILDEAGRFEVLKRAGNVAVQVFCDDGVGGMAPVRQILGADGEIDGATEGLLVLTFAVSIGFPRIEALVEAVCTEVQAGGWQYGNVYADDEGRVPLNWWQ